MNFWYLIAGASLSLSGALFHGIVGHKKYIVNINLSNLPDVSKSLSLVSWHVFTIFLIFSSLSLAFVAFSPNAYFIVYPIIGINLAGTALFLFLGAGKHRVLLKLPGAYLMGGTAVFAFLGI